MRLYIAARYQDQARALAAELTKVGHVITSTWLNDEKYGEPKDRADKPAIAQTDLDEILDSEALVLMAQPKGDYSPGGRHVEFGFALALGLPVYLLGERENVFHYLSQVGVYETVPALIEALKVSHEQKIERGGGH